MQLSLLDQLPPGPDEKFCSLQRTELERGAWIDFAPEWFTGHQGLMQLLTLSCDWERHRRVMYDRIVEVPRLVAGAPGSGQDFDWRDGEMRRTKSRARPSQIEEARTELARLAGLLSVRYQKVLSSVTLGYYRDGHDSVAYHGDKMGVLRPNTVVAILSVGERRNFHLRPAGGGPRHSFRFGGGDLLVMGGTCQQTYEHAVPKMSSCGPRLAVMFREKIPVPLLSDAGLANTARRAATESDVVAQDNSPRLRDELIFPGRPARRRSSSPRRVAV